jgi:putative Mg2+ transporter-C (MgtC) family protein
LALVLGGLIGLERELTGHPAGLRTHIGVALGAALFAMVSAYGFEEFDASRAVTNFQVDPTRVASNIVVGIGFLGGGAIVKQGSNVRGLTTAASLWVTAAIGMGCALGSYTATLVATGLLLASLLALRGPARMLRQRVRAHETVHIRLDPEADPGSVVRALSELEGVTVRSLTIRELDDGCIVRADLVGERGGDLERAVAPIADVEGVSSLEVT